ncbi:ADP-ribosylglycohydrolase family protein [Microcoleus sp. herbarium19]|uniref:ADP-ribosylglycohydrolase family protein n=1 Tax=unclassified Microcoleus TaxID=2642155 RepID=UPI002FD34A35
MPNSQFPIPHSPFPIPNYVMQEIERYRGSLLGLAVGDALGTTLEFCRPGTFTPINDRRLVGRSLFNCIFWRSALLSIQLKSIRQIGFGRVF